MRIFFVFFLLISVVLSCKRPTRLPQDRGSTGEKIYSDRESRSSRTYIEPTRDSKPNREIDKQPKQVKISPTEEESISELFKTLEKGVFMVIADLGEEGFSQGSGFFIDDGIGITNYHVLDGSHERFIVINKEVYKIDEILATSPSDELDYVIFKTDYTRNMVLKISGEIPDIGEDVFAIGSPQGLSNSLTKGTISGFRENERIQIDATIDHGSSGGPLFNLKGEVIGITSSGLGTGSELNFAVNIQALPYKNHIRN